MHGMMSMKLLHHMVKQRGVRSGNTDSIHALWGVAVHQINLICGQRKMETESRTSSAAEVSRPVKLLCGNRILMDSQSFVIPSMGVSFQGMWSGRQYHTLIPQRQQTPAECRYTQVRAKSKKKVYDSDRDTDDDDDDDGLDEDDFDAPSNFKSMKIHTASLRADAIISSSLNIARNRLDEIFLGSGLMVNGSTMTKKSEKMDEGDYVDVISAKMDDQLKVKRVKVIKVYPEKTGTGKFVVKIRVWKSPFLIDAPSKR
ncbi:mitochondrial transcription rescue factor 1 [Aplysia californica]|uniref:Mitochondrial transcription rescue factor 1 n=1 Tax=Aplysia californica TaxID=6500 RepID=A0ABM0K285_APLCA|nr:mitochondrial transcription rescue factor 1 [Aplysia californica]XP_005107018.1 mitochondrial transcription rescue factor 1 [Aplysia californica]